MTKAAKRKNRSTTQAAADATVTTDVEALSRVREILFGETVREHSGQLGEVKKHLDQEVEALRAEYAAQVASLRADMKREVDSLRWQLEDLGREKLSRRDLGTMLSEVADQISSVD